MAEPTPVRMPLLNPNEPEAMIVDLLVANGDRVDVGQRLATVETTKSAVEIGAPATGYVAGLAAKPGQSLRAGDVLLWLAAEEGWQPPAAEEQTPEERPGGARLTEPARNLAAEAGVDPERLPTDVLITADWLENWLAEEAGLPDIDAAALLVYGGGGHGKSVIDLVRALGEHRLVGVIDDNMKPGDEVLGLGVLGGGDQLAGLRRQGIGLAVNAVGGIGDIGSRIRIFDRLRAAGFGFPTLVHPSAVVEANAQLGDGVQVFPHAYVGSQARAGFGAIVNTAAVVSHDCMLGDYVNIAPGALLAGAVTVGDRSLLGMGVTVNLAVTVGQGARLGNSATVKADVPAGGVVPAGSIWPLPAERGQA